MESNLKYYDVNSLCELPELKDKNVRYIDFIGGTKEIRVFVVPRNLSRKDFFKYYPEYNDNDLFAPIYENKGIEIAPDMSYAVPGFYILIVNEHLHHCDTLSDATMMRIGFLLKELRKGLRVALNIECCCLYSEEKEELSNPLHYWMVPKYPEYLKEKLNHKLVDIELNKYFDNFKYSQYKEKIIESNKTMRNYFKNINLRSKDNEIIDIIERTNK